MIPDEDHEVIYERVAAVDVAKASGVVCMRTPDPARPGRFANRIWDDVPAMRARITRLGRELLRAPGADGDAGVHQRLLADLAAPRGALLYPRLSREEFGGYSWV